MNTKNGNKINKKAILLVDDDMALLDIGEKMLTRLNYEVYTASGCDEAISITKNHLEKITCAIIDLTMPEIDGIETLKQIKKINPDIRVILSSGYLEDQIQERYSDTQPDEYIQKPFQFSELLSKLQKLNGIT